MPYDIDKAYTSCLWYDNISKSTNDKFMDLYADKHRYLVLMGGGGSGKSIFAGRKVLERIVSEENHRVLVCRKVARTLRESCFAQLGSQICEHYDARDFKLNKTDMTISYPKTTSQIIFAGLDDVEKLKSIYNITMIWIEEASELQEGDLNQLDIRLRGQTSYYKQIIITFNPIDINHWLKKRFFDKVNKEARTHHSTYIDNRFLDEQAKMVLERYKNIDPYYYDVYCLGQWGVLGRTIFDSIKVQTRISQLNEKHTKGQFEYSYNKIHISNIKFSEDPFGAIHIYCEPKPNHFYVIGADTAGEGSDTFSATVLDNLTCEQVATLHQTYDEDLFAKQIYCLGKYYNNALIGIESNFSTFPIMELERLGYDNQYVRTSFDSYTHKHKQSFGFRTTSQTRPVLIACLVEALRDAPENFNDLTTLNQMLTFVRNEKGRSEAQYGAHDDSIMATAIALVIRDQQQLITREERAEPIYNFKFEEPSENPLGYMQGGSVI